MKYLRHATNVGATLVLGLVIARIFGSISFSPRATELLVRCAASLDIYGDEHIEDFFMSASLLAALLIAAALVTAASAMLRRTGRQV